MVPRNSLKCSKAFSLRLNDPRIVKTRGNIIAILIKVRSMSKLMPYVKHKYGVMIDTKSAIHVRLFIITRYGFKFSILDLIS